MTQYALNFYEIPNAVKSNDEFRTQILDLVSNEPMPGKVTEGGDRLTKLRGILEEFFEGDLSLQESIGRIRTDLPRHQSQYARNNRVFSDGWDERLARTQISRFYNQAVLLSLKESGEDECFIPQSEHEDFDSNCTLKLAGGTEKVDVLLERLNRAYNAGEWHNDVMVPDHPHCTHTVTPDRAEYRG